MASYYRTYRWRDYHDTVHTVSVRIPEAALEASIAAYGYREEEAYAVQVKALRALCARYGVTVKTKRQGATGVALTCWHEPAMGWKQFNALAHTAMGDAFDRYLVAHGIHHDRARKLIMADYAALQGWERPRLHPLAVRLGGEMQARHLGRRGRLELLLSLTQSLLYEIPPDVDHGRQTLGVFTPTQVAVYKKGDCDSKSLFFATLWPGGPAEVILVEVPHHIFLAVRGFHATARDQTVVQIGGVDYLLCEATEKGWRPGDVPEDDRRHIRKHRARFIRLG